MYSCKKSDKKWCYRLSTVSTVYSLIVSKSGKTPGDELPSALPKSYAYSHSVAKCDAGFPSYPIANLPCLACFSSSPSSLRFAGPAFSGGLRLPGP